MYSLLYRTGTPGLPRTPLSMAVDNCLEIRRDTLARTGEKERQTVAAEEECVRAALGQKRPLEDNGDYTSLFVIVKIQYNSVYKTYLYQKRRNCARI